MSVVKTKIIIDCSTGEETVVPLSAEEISEMETRAEQAELRRLQEIADVQAKSELRASAKAKLIAGQPLTAEEADVLII